MPRLLSVNVGLPRDIQWRGRTVHTGIWKEAVQGRRRVDRLNVEGDGQGDLGGHGGEQRAVFVYQIESYRHWAERLGRHDFTPGQFGENFTIEGLPDAEVCIGDRFRIGTALFEVTQPRTTCYRVGIRLDEPQMAALLTSSGRPGFYFRVLEEGEVGADDPILPVAGGPERLTIAEVECPAVFLASSPGAARACPADPGALAGVAVVVRGVAAESGRAPRRDGQRRPGPGCGCPDRAAGVPATPGVGNRSGVRRRHLAVARADRRKAARHSRSPASSWCSGCARSRTPLASSAATRSPDRSPHEQYRISVKLEAHGAAGSYLNDHVQAGGTLDVSEPRGSFILQPGDGPVVLLSAGIGATPVLAMLHALAASASPGKSGGCTARATASPIRSPRKSRQLLGDLARAARSRLVQPTRCG